MLRISTRRLVHALIAGAIAFALAGCGDETAAVDAGNVLPDEAMETPLVLTPGDDGALLPSAVQVSSLTLEWAPASVTGSATGSEADLEYRLYHSTTEDLLTVEEVKDHGTPLGDWTVGLLSAAVDGLDEGRAYTFNVLVRLPGEGVEAYEPLAVVLPTTDAPVPGFSGLITAEALSANSIRLEWVAATDDETPAAALEYRVYKRLSHRISLLADVLDAGQTTGPWVVGVTEATITGLEEVATYGLNVLVRDEHGALAAYDGAFTKTLDQTPPSIGQPTLAVSEVKANAAVVTWSAAEDNATATGDLMYAVVYSESDDIQSVSDALDNGTIAVDWSAGTTSATVPGLMPATDYFINVMVRDQAGNHAVYTATTLKTLRAVWLYSAGSHHGSLARIIHK